MRTITLELLRHGPAHNQLLSPLNHYLALCENHPAVTLQIPMEHHELLHRLSALSYRMGAQAREFQLRDTARFIGDLLAGIPGLTADMNRRDGTSEDASSQNSIADRPTHLRLILSASELALLPFELAISPIGFPGAGQPLLLQSAHPVAITRETRRVVEEQLVWPTQARVLFVSASPPGLPTVPAAAHLLAIRRMLEPWIGSGEHHAESGASQSSVLGQHLTVLTEASLDAIEAACSEEAYLLEKLIRPIARVDVGRALLASGDCSSCMDMTDGAGQSLRELAEASNVSIEIDYSKLPINPIVHKVAKLLNSSVEKIVFGIGLDLELLGTTRTTSHSLSSRLKYFGRVVGGGPGAVIDYGTRKGPIPVSGWQHFTGSAMDKVRQMYEA